MKAIVWRDKDTAISVERFPDRKRPALCISKGTFAMVYGYFRDDVSAELFMSELANLVGAKSEENDIGFGARF